MILHIGPNALITNSLLRPISYSFPAPVWYSQYRFYLSILIGTCIIVTLWGETFFNPVQEDSLLASAGPNLIKNAQVDPTDDEGRITGTMASLGDIETIEGDSHYVIIKKKAEAGTDEEEGEGEEGGEASSSDSEEKEEDDGKDATGGDQTGDAQDHLDEVAKKQVGKDADQRQGKAGGIKNPLDQS